MSIREVEVTVGRVVRLLEFMYSANLIFVHLMPSIHVQLQIKQKSMGKIQGFIQLPRTVKISVNQASQFHGEAKT